MHRQRNKTKKEAGKGPYLKKVKPITIIVLFFRDNSDNTQEEKDQLWLDILDFLDNSVSSSKYLSLAVFQSIMVRILHLLGSQQHFFRDNNVLLEWKSDPIL